MVKMGTQSIKNVERFSGRPDVNKEMVENFLMNMSIGGVPATIEKLVDSAKTHNWNKETIEAILDGILTYSGLEIDDITMLVTCHNRKIKRE